MKRWCFTSPNKTRHDAMVAQKISTIQNTTEPSLCKKAGDKFLGKMKIIFGLSTYRKKSTITADVYKQTIKNCTTIAEWIRFAKFRKKSEKMCFF